MIMKALTKLPWKVLMPTLVSAAKEFVEKQVSKSRAPLDLERDISAQLPAIIERLKTVEASQIDQGNLTRQIAERLHEISIGLANVSLRANVALWLGIGALAVSGITLLITVTR